MSGSIFLSHTVNNCFCEQTSRPRISLNRSSEFWITIMRCISLISLPSSLNTANRSSTKWLLRSMMKLHHPILWLHGFCKLFWMKKCGSMSRDLCRTTLRVVYYPMTRQLPSTSLLLLTASSYCWKACHSLLTFQISSELFSTTLLHRHLRSPPACPTLNLSMSGTSSEFSCALIFNLP